MQKRILALPLAAVLLLVACAKGPTWQEQYDLGMRYLSEGNYQEAVIAFAAAIAIDEKRPEAFISRGDAYMGLAATADDPTENLGLAAADYQTALTLDDTNADVYERLADVYLQQGDTEKALSILQQGVDKTGDAGLQQRLEELNGQKQTLDMPEGEETVLDYERGDSWFWDNFQPLADIPSEEQQVIHAAATATAAGDVDTLCALAADAADVLYRFTIWNDYKIYVCNYSDGLLVEMRPENGTGYFARISVLYSLATDLETVEETIEITMLASGQCEDWQWNGTYTEIETEAHKNSITQSMAKTGTVQMGLRQGTFAVEMWWDGGSDQFEEVYQDGVMIALRRYADGVLVYESTYPSGEEIVWGIGGVDYFSDEERYW